MKHYELLFVVKPTLTEEEMKAKFDFIKGIVESNDCEVKAVKDMGIRKLAYEIEKHERGHYFVLYFVGPTTSMEEILRNLRLTEEIIRFLNVKFEKKKEIAQWEKLAKAAAEKTAAKAEAKVETPKVVETPVVEAPKAEETPVEEAPKAEEAPKKDAE